MPDLSIKKWDEVNGLGSSERMEAFLTSSTDAYAILQLRYSDETSKERFMSMSSLKRLGLEPDIDHYEVVYVGNLEPYKDRETMLKRCTPRSTSIIRRISGGTAFPSATSWRSRKEVKYPVIMWIP